MRGTLIKELEKKTDTAENGRLVCFVCTGNTCRSPMAEAVFNHMARISNICSMSDADKLINAKDVRAVSAGLAAFGEPISENAVLALREAGIPSTPGNDYEGHISREIDLEIMRKAELVVGISSSHAMRLMSLYPQYASKITCMPEDIADPYGGSPQVYRECLCQIKSGVEKIYSSL